jgi:cyclophilin family peptidyl-prolyl cis-trans isomerase
MIPNMKIVFSLLITIIFAYGCAKSKEEDKSPGDKTEQTAMGIIDTDMAQKTSPDGDVTLKIADMTNEKTPEKVIEKTPPVSGPLSIACKTSVEKDKSNILPKDLIEKAFKTKTPQVLIETSMGDILVQLDAEKAPISVRNFLTYSAEKFYENTLFHRVISNFMIQGGGFTPEKTKKDAGLHPTIKNEAKNGLSNARGTIAMARTQVVDSAQAQFYINVVNNQKLDHKGEGRAYGYAVFGKVLEGMDVADLIRSVPTINEGDPFSSLPDPPVFIKSTKICR